MTLKLETVLDGLVFPEGPRWHDGELYFSDMHAHEIVALKPGGAHRTVAAFASPVSGLGWLPDGRLLVVAMQEQGVLRRERDGSFVPHGDISAIATGLANDMVVDAHGHAFIGNFGFSLHPPGEPKAATLARVDPDGSAHAAAPGLMFPNGMVVTADGRTLIVGESWGRRLTAFELAADGVLSGRREWAAMPGKALPDGICLDEEGAIWVASPATSEVLRVREGGAIAERIATEQLAIACMLGGANRKTLYILTSESTDPDICRNKRNARIQAVRVDVAGAGLP